MQSYYQTGNVMMPNQTINRVPYPNPYRNPNPPMYGNPYPNPNPQMYARNKWMKTDRSMGMFLLLSFLTFGIYAIYFYTVLGKDMNEIATKRDHEHTTHYCLVAFLLVFITFGIYGIVWMHQISRRIGNEARARGIRTDFGAETMWLWCILGAFIFVGPFVYMHRLCKTMNQICMDYNRRGY